MQKVKHLAFSAVMNWVALAANMLIGFLLSPYVVHHLGNMWYGVWTLTVAINGYLGLLDLGLRGAITRFVARDYAQGNHAAAGQAVSAALYFRLSISALIITLSVVLGRLGPSLLHIPPEAHTSLRWALLFSGLSLCTNLTLGVFGGVLAALHRFDVISSVTVCQTALRAIGAVQLLRDGHGIVALAMWELTVVLCANLVLVYLCFHCYPSLRLIGQAPSLALVRKFFSYSGILFFIHIGQQLIFYTDNLLVGAFVSAAAVTLYSIGGSLTEYLRQIVSSLTATFMPLASSLDAQNNTNDMKLLLIQGTRAALLIALPIASALFFRGETFISLWMGHEYAEASGPVMRILLVSIVVVVANFTSINIVYGIGRHRPVAIWTICEAVANFTLSILLVRRIGMIGVAWGTLLPSLAINVLLWPAFICRVVGLRIPYYLWQSWIKPLLAAIPFGLACYLTQTRWHAAHLYELFAQIVALLPLFLAAVAGLFWKDIARLARKQPAIASPGAQHAMAGNAEPISRAE